MTQSQNIISKPISQKAEKNKETLVKLDLTNSSKQQELEKPLKMKLPVSQIKEVYWSEEEAKRKETLGKEMEECLKAEIRSSQEEMKASLDQQLISIQQHLEKQFQGPLSELKTEVKAAVNSLTSLRKTVVCGFGKQKGALADAQQMSRDQQNQLEDHLAKYALAHLQGQIERLQEEKGRLQAQLAHLQGQIERLQEEKGRLQAQLAHLQGQIERLQEEKAHLQGQIERLQEEKGRLQAQLAHLQGQIERLQEEKGRLQAQLAHLQGQIERLQEEKAQGKEENVDVSLDADTAHPRLEVSPDGKSVKDTGTARSVPRTEKRFDSHTFLLAKEGYTSGKYYWEVDVGKRRNWDVGIAREPVTRKGTLTLSPEKGFWVIGLADGKDYWARTEPWTRLVVSGKPRKIGIFLDVSAKKLSFFNVSKKTAVYTFTLGGDSSQGGKFFPFFSTGSTSAKPDTEPLKIVLGFDEDHDDE
ncbi:E3 ubiquitin-protein ligase TRIM39-like [Apteryx mantelli]|uniref:E3 ubiquitin-protein ligase TRIM39-like n=1 Tax=Apteryx mantelli TaxID=2696672 RepID=A0ABM4FZK7_9AVES